MILKGVKFMHLLVHPIMPGKLTRISQIHCVPLPGFPRLYVHMAGCILIFSSWLGIRMGFFSDHPFMVMYNGAMPRSFLCGYIRLKGPLKRTVY